MITNYKSKVIFIINILYMIISSKKMHQVSYLIWSLKDIQ